MFSICVAKNEGRLNGESLMTESTVTRMICHVPGEDRDRHGEQRQHKIVAQSLCKGVKPQNGRAFFLFHNIPVAFPVRILSKQKRRSRPHLKLLLARAVSRRYGHLFAHLTLCRVFSIGTEKRVEAKASSPSQRVCRKNRLFCVPLPNAMNTQVFTV